jgi:hypothetical protein
MKEEIVFGNSKANRDLPPVIVRDLLAQLKNNNELNQMTTPLEAAAKAGGDTSSYCTQLNAEVGSMKHVQSELAVHNGRIIQRLVDALSQVNGEKARLADTLSSLSGYEFIFNLRPILDQLQDERCCVSLKSSISNITRKPSRGLISTLLSDPWMEAKNTVAALDSFNNEFNSFILSYTGNIDIIELNDQFLRLKKQYSDNQINATALQQKIESAKQADERYQKAIGDTIDILESYIRTGKRDTTFGFVGSHWGKILAGGISGGAAAATVLFVSTNPVLLAACITAGVVVGTAGGTGSGLLQDVITEKKETKRASSYGSFWQSNAAAAAAPEAAAPESSSSMALKK